MVKYILGLQGSGKTKWLVNRANEEMLKGNGNIVFVDVDDDHIFNLNYTIRLINAVEFKISSIEALYGFLCGIIGQDYDVEKVYIDGIYKIMKLDIDAMEELSKKLGIIGEEFDVEFFIGADFRLEQLPQALRDNCIELETE
ncbi:MAG: hypothetical protein GX329_01490 [Tissierellia bacterium]|nr:hypothetical protein [Tissierellia bacterium]